MKALLLRALLAFTALLLLPSGTTPGLGMGSTAEPRGPVDLVIERSAGGMALYADNPMHGPVEVQLRAPRLSGATSEPDLPLRRVLAAKRRSLLAHVSLLSGQDRAETTFVLESVPGDPLASPRDVVYSLPIDSAAWELGQGFHGSYSHADAANRYAIDLVVAEGTPVLAARGGIVMEALSGFGTGSTDRARDYDRANLVRILHDDGSMAIYAHLKERGVLVDPGNRVSLGQVIAVSGNSGFSSGPHLHFCIQANQGMRLVSIPFRMVGPQGYLPVGKH